jgi:hypothetical protein
VFGIVQFVYCLAVAFWYEMSVGIDGDLNGVVTHLLFHVGEKLPILDEQTGKGVLRSWIQICGNPAFLRTVGKARPQIWSPSSKVPRSETNTKIGTSPQQLSNVSFFRSTRRAFRVSVSC